MPGKIITLDRMLDLLNQKIEECKKKNEVGVAIPFAVYTLALALSDLSKEREKCVKTLEKLQKPKLLLSNPTVKLSPEQIKQKSDHLLSKIQEIDDKFTTEYATQVETATQTLTELLSPRRGVPLVRVDSPKPN